MKTRFAIFAVVAVLALLPAATNIAQTGNPTPGALVTSATTSQAGTAVLSVVSGFRAQPGTVDPLVGKHLVLFKEGFENFMRRTRMFEGPPGSPTKATPLAVWAYACQTQSPMCQQALYEMRPNAVSEVKMGSNGRASFPGVPAGSYYLYTVTAHNRQFLVWDLRVDLKPGANSITLDSRNVAPLDGSSRPNQPPGGNQSVAESQPCPVTDGPRTARPGARGNSTLSVIGAGYTYTYTRTDGQTGAVLDSFTERGNFSNTALYLLDEDAENILQRGGIEPGLLGSRFAMMAFIDAGTQVEDIPGMSLLASMFGHGGMPAEFAKEARADFDCAMKAIRVYSVAEMTTNANARGTFPSVPAGTYYLYGRFYRLNKPVRAGGMFWNLKIELKPGQNAVRLSVNNAAWKAGN